MGACHLGSLTCASGVDFSQQPPTQSHLSPSSIIWHLLCLTLTVPHGLCSNNGGPNTKRRQINTMHSRDWLVGAPRRRLHRETTDCKSGRRRQHHHRHHQLSLAARQAKPQPAFSPPNAAILPAATPRGYSPHTEKLHWGSFPNDTSSALLPASNPMVSNN